MKVYFNLMVPLFKFDKNYVQFSCLKFCWSYEKNIQNCTKLSRLLNSHEGFHHIFFQFAQTSREKESLGNAGISSICVSWEMRIIHAFDCLCFEQLNFSKDPTFIQKLSWLI